MRTDPYLVDRDLALQVVRDSPFGSLIFYDGEVRRVSIPLIYRPHENVIVSHTPYRFNESTQFNDVLIHSRKSDAYISARWRSKKNPVPTWDFIEVDVRGRMEVISDKARIEQILDESASHYDWMVGEKPWSIQELPADYKDGLVRRIVGIRIHIGDVNGRFKLDQDYSTEDARAAIDGLRRHGSPNSLRIAEEIEKELAKRK